MYRFLKFFTFFGGGGGGGWGGEHQNEHQKKFSVAAIALEEMAGWEHDMWRGKRETRWTVRGLNQTPIAPRGAIHNVPIMLHNAE